MSTFYSTIWAVVCSAQRRSMSLVAMAALTTGLLVHVGLPSGASAQAPRSPAGPSATAAGPTPAQAGYPGVWFDDTGRGAVEVLPCGDRLCGRIVWLQEATDKAGRPITDDYNPDPRLKRRPVCGIDVIGGLKRQQGGTWDEGWIYDPKQGKQFDVELKLRSADSLQVMGYIGVKFLSETFVWRRAPADLKRC